MVMKTGTNKRDILKGSSTVDELAGLAGNDDLFGLAGHDTLDGGDGNDLLDGGKGIDSMKGGKGNDTYIVDNRADSISDTSGIDLVKSSVSYTLRSGLERLTLTGSKAINGVGNSVANIILGNVGANIIDGKAGADIMKGGAGNDTYIVDNKGDKIADTSGIDTVKSSVSFTLAAGVEKLTLTGSKAINGTGNGAANTITGNAAVNILDGKAGADILKGGAGNDTYIVDNVGDKVSDTAGVDTVKSSISYTLLAGFEKLLLTGSAAINGTGNGAANTITGNGAKNVLSGLAGADALFGGAGDDLLKPGDDMVGDRIDGGSGTDTVDYSGNTSAVIASLFDQVSGGSATGDRWFGVENVIGTSFGDTLRGANGGDAYGGAGDDLLQGSGAAGSTVNAGRLRGDAGMDTLDMRFGVTQAWLQRDSGADTINNFFEGVDKFFIDLSDWGFGTSLEANEIRNLHLFDPISNAPQFVFNVVGFHASISYDANGDGLGEVVVAGLAFPGLDMVGGNYRLEPDDFVFIV